MNFKSKFLDFVIFTIKVIIVTFFINITIENTTRVFLNKIPKYTAISNNNLLFIVNTQTGQVSRYYRNYKTDIMGNPTNITKEEGIASIGFAE